MKKAETAPKKLLLLTLLPTLALGAVEVASRVHVPAPVATIEQAPDVVPVHDHCGACVTTA